MTVEDRERYRKAVHAMQSGVLAMMPFDSSDTTPKHLRVGINSALCDSTGLAKLLMKKGVFTQDEYEKAIADEMEEEVERYRKRLKYDWNIEVNLL